MSTGPTAASNQAQSLDHAPTYIVLVGDGHAGAAPPMTRASAPAAATPRATQFFHPTGPVDLMLCLLEPLDELPVVSTA